MAKHPQPSSIQRTFRDLTDAEMDDVEGSFLGAEGWYGAIGWSELLQSKRILIDSEAGVGKTYECQEQQKILWAAGEAAFFLDLATLASRDVRAMLSTEEEARFDAWLRSQADVATFFLDSYDELLLTQGKFDDALRRLAKALSGQLGRARIVITTRPVPIDRKLITEHLPLPPVTTAVPTAEGFADLLMNRKKQAQQPDTPVPKPWRNVRLLPLSNAQMRDFALTQEVKDPDELIADIERRHAEEFARRPQDLIEICADWRAHKRIRRHSDQVESNVAIKLKARSHIHRKERTAISPEFAMEGASRLALAAILTRKLTLRYNADTDSVEASTAALDTATILHDWTDDQRNTLLERALFGFASYGRVRFHHRSVLEFLAAKRLDALLRRPLPTAMRSVKRLLFTETAQGAKVVRPSMRPVAAWLALWHDAIFDEVIAREPDVVLDHGDPESLRPEQRIRALDAYTLRYGGGGWRGLSTPSLQIHRFAGPELGETVARIWRAGIENPEVRQLLIRIIGEGRLNDCSHILFGVAPEPSSPFMERILALRGLVQLSDPRIPEIVTSLENDRDKWAEAVAKRALVELFPRHVSVAQFIKIVRRLSEAENNIGELKYNLPREIETGELSPDYLDELRQGLTDLILEGAEWKPTEHPHFRTPRPFLIQALRAACRRQAAMGVRSLAWTMSSLLIFRVGDDHDADDRRQLSELRTAIAELTSEEREAAFWAEDRLIQSLRRSRDNWHRVFELGHRGGLQLTSDLDGQWIRRRLSDPKEPLDHREMMLWAEMTLLLRRRPDEVLPSLDELKHYVADAPSLLELIAKRSEPNPSSEELGKMEAEHQAQMAKMKARDAEAHASWVRFWHEVRSSPEGVFADDRAETTAWNLWRAMARTDGGNRSSVWNRRFIEAEFGQAVADQLRTAMRPFWRKDKPTLRSERKPQETDRFLTRWQFGLTCIAAEAEDPDWAKRLTHEEAMLACRYATIELNQLPAWLADIIAADPSAVDAILGEELSTSVSGDDEPYSSLLQHIRSAASEVAKAFLTRMRTWLETSTKATRKKKKKPPSPQNVDQAIQLLLKHGDEHDRAFIRSAALRVLSTGLLSAWAEIWLSALFHVDPNTGLEALEKALDGGKLPADRRGDYWFAKLFSSFHRDDAINVRTLGLGPRELLRLLRLAYRHVPPTEDRPPPEDLETNDRNNAERARHGIFNAFLETRGTEAWDAKLELAHDPLFADFKDRALALAEEAAAEDADATAQSEEACVQLDSGGEAPPVTTADTFALMCDRLDDVDDLLLRDTSPRELWASITQEHILRKDLARQFEQGRNGVYTVDQEAVTADGKETDIRLRVAASGQQGTFELKIGEKNRSASDLRSALREQLLNKYMAAQQSRAGILVISIARDKGWRHPESGARLDFVGLIQFLQEEAAATSKELGGAVRLTARGLDLRPRLKPERSTKLGKTKRKSSVKRPKTAGASKAKSRPKKRPPAPSKAKKAKRRS